MTEEEANVEHSSHCGEPTSQRVVIHGGYEIPGAAQCHREHEDTRPCRLGAVDGDRRDDNRSDSGNPQRSRRPVTSGAHHHVKLDNRDDGGCSNQDGKEPTARKVDVEDDRYPDNGCQDPDEEIRGRG